MTEYINREEFLKRFNALHHVLDNLEKMLCELIDVPKQM